MQLKDKIYDIMVENKLFLKNYFSVRTQIANLLLKPKSKIDEQLTNLKNDGSIRIFNKKLINNRQLKKGTYISSKLNLGYVEIEGDGNKYCVENNNIALNGDVVEVYINLNDDLPKATIYKVLEKNNKNIIGRVVETTSGVIAFIPDKKQFGDIIAIQQNEISRNAVGHKCIISLVNSNDNLVSVGKIEKVLGLAGDPITENVSIASKYGFEKEFSNKVLNEVKYIPKSVSDEDCKIRLDLRNKKFVTIDPETCKDMDDAVYIEKTSKGYKIYIAIADVAHYVKLNSEIDKEAFRRGTSDYLGDGVYPMLPEELSNGICSLNENVDRLVRATIVDIDSNGNILDYKLAPAVINSKHKLSYDIADDIHFNRNGADIKYSDVKNQIDMMFKASDILVKVRKDRGALFIESEEPTFKLDATKTQVLDITNHHTELESTKIIESFMILNNEVVGKYFIDNNVFTMFRVHEKPLPSQIDELNEILRVFQIGMVEANSFSYQKIAAKIKGNNYESYLNDKILKSMQKAVYSPQTIGHFGLASNNYLHFTSPIRRYADLIVHRILNSFETDKKYMPTLETLEFMGKHISEREKNAKDSEAESNKLMYTMWAESQINKELEGKIFDFTPNGVIVKHNLIELYIPYNEFYDIKQDGYKLNKTNTILLNKSTGIKYKIGDKIKFTIISSNRIDRSICATTDLCYLKENKGKNIKNNDNDLIL